ncbi:unnamed protein product, partial [Notodromas monacha]
MLEFHPVCNFKGFPKTAWTYLKAFPLVDSILVSDVKIRERQIVGLYASSSLMLHYAQMKIGKSTHHLTLGVFGFPLDAMHIIGGGAASTGFEFLFRKHKSFERSVRLGSDYHSMVNDYLIAWSKKTVKEMNRQVRTFNQMDQWKMREAHECLIYHSVALLAVDSVRLPLDPDIIHAFMSFVVAMHLVGQTTHECPSTRDVQMADKLFRHYVEEFMDYSPYFLKPKNHLLIHLASEVAAYRSHLGGFDAYPFENFLRIFRNKTLVRSGKGVLMQIFNRLGELSVHSIPTDYLGAVMAYKVKVMEEIKAVKALGKLSLPAQTVVRTNLKRKKKTVVCFGYEVTCKYPDNVVAVCIPGKQDTMKHFIPIVISDIVEMEGNGELHSTSGNLFETAFHTDPLARNAKDHQELGYCSGGISKTQFSTEKRAKRILKKPPRKYWGHSSDDQVIESEESSNSGEEDNVRLEKMPRMSNDCKMQARTQPSITQSDRIRLTMEGPPQAAFMSGFDRQPTSNIVSDEAQECIKPAIKAAFNADAFASTCENLPGTMNEDVIKKTSVGDMSGAKDGFMKNANTQNPPPGRGSWVTNPYSSGVTQSSHVNNRDVTLPISPEYQELGVIKAYAGGIQLRAKHGFMNKASPPNHSADRGSWGSNHYSNAATTSSRDMNKDRAWPISAADQERVTMKAYVGGIQLGAKHGFMNKASPPSHSADRGSWGSNQYSNAATTNSQDMTKDRAWPISTADQERVTMRNVAEAFSDGIQLGAKDGYVDASTPYHSADRSNWGSNPNINGVTSNSQGNSRHCALPVSTSYPEWGVMIGQSVNLPHEYGVVGFPKALQGGLGCPCSKQFVGTLVAAVNKASCSSKGLSQQQGMTEASPLQDAYITTVEERDSQEWTEEQDDPNILDNDELPLSLRHRVAMYDLKLPLNKFPGFFAFFEAVVNLADVRFDDL